MVETSSAADVLRNFYDRNGCIRVRPDDPERGRHGGVELRLVIGDMIERKAVLAAMKELRVPHGKVYRKQRTRRQWVVPVYSRADIVAFMKAVKPKGATGLIKRVQGSARRPI